MQRRRVRMWPMKTDGAVQSRVPNAMAECSAVIGGSLMSESCACPADIAFSWTGMTRMQDNGTHHGFELDTFRVELAIPMDGGKSEQA